MNDEQQASDAVQRYCCLSSILTATQLSNEEKTIKRILNNDVIVEKVINIDQISRSQTAMFSVHVAN